MSSPRDPGKSSRHNPNSPNKWYTYTHTPHIHVDTETTVYVRVCVTVQRGLAQILQQQDQQLRAIQQQFAMGAGGSPWNVG